MSQRDFADHEAANSGLTAARASTNPLDAGFAEPITAEFTSRRHTCGVADRWIPTRQRNEP